MNRFINLSKKEKAGYITLIALYPFMLLFAQLGKVCKLFGSKKRQVTASVLCAAMLLTILPLGAFSVKADAGEVQVKWSDYAATEFAAGGIGTIGDPYKIGSASELALFSNIVNGISLPDDISQDPFACGELTADIYLNSSSTSLNDYNGWDLHSWRTWVAIGASSDDPFCGRFEGNNHVISGIYINYSDISLDFQGLFGVIGKWSSVSNVTIQNSYISVTGFVGSVCGTNLGGTIKGCSNYGTIYGKYHVGGICGSGDEAASIIDCNNYGKVNGKANDVGGIVGGIKNNCTVKGCNNSGEITAAAGHTGGVCGSLEGGRLHR